MRVDGGALEEGVDIAMGLRLGSPQLLTGYRPVLLILARKSRGRAEGVRYNNERVARMNAGFFISR